MQNTLVKALLLGCSALLSLPALSDPPPGKGNASQSGQPGSQGQNQGKSQGKGQGQGQGKGTQDVDSSTSITAGLVTAGITIAAARDLAVGAGLTGYTALPPGIAKNLGRGKPLPPGIAKKAVPGAMLARLPVHPGYEWQQVGTDLVLLAVGTAIVADVLTGVFR